MSALTSVIIFSLLSCAFGYHHETTCKHRHERCQRYQQDCSIMSSCCDFPHSPGYQAAPKSGNYIVQLGKYSTTRAFCDMETDGGGWTVIFRRTASNLTFDRYYQEYEDGFGELHGDFWYGLRAMRDLTTRTPYEMRLDMFENADDKNSSAHAFYNNFKVEGDGYMLHVGRFNGSDAALENNLIQFNGRRFYAKQTKQKSACIDSFKAGWWYVNEDTCLPEDQTPGTILTIENFGLVEWHESTKEPPIRARIFQKYEMKIRPRSCIEDNKSTGTKKD